MFIDPKPPQPDTHPPVAPEGRQDDGVDRPEPRPPLERSFEDWIALGYLPG